MALSRSLLQPRKIAWMSQLDRAVRIFFSSRGICTLLKGETARGSSRTQ